MARKKKENTEWPQVTKGSHLTVIKHENGKIDLEWDDEALLRDVQEAIASVETKPKKTKKAKDGK